MQGNTGQARYCLSKAISADPEDISLRYHDAALHMELGKFQNAAESFVKILQICPENVQALKTGAKVICISACQKPFCFYLRLDMPHFRDMMVILFFILLLYFCCYLFPSSDKKQHIY